MLRLGGVLLNTVTPQMYSDTVVLILIELWQGLVSDGKNMVEVYGWLCCNYWQEF